MRTNYISAVVVFASVIFFLGVYITPGAGMTLSREDVRGMDEGAFEARQKRSPDPLSEAASGVHFKRSPEFDGEAWRDPAVQTAAAKQQDEDGMAAGESRKKRSPRISETVVAMPNEDSRLEKRSADTLASKDAMVDDCLAGRRKRSPRVRDIEAIRRVDNLADARGLWLGKSQKK